MIKKGYILDRYNKFQNQKNEIELIRYNDEDWCIRIINLDDNGLPILPITFEDAPLYPQYYKVWPSIAAIHLYLNQ